MTPKEKARELTNRLSYYVSVEKDLNDPRSYQQVMTENVKQCALIAVNEIIKNTSSYTTLKELSNWYSIIGYWEEVKKEIEKL